MSMPPVWKASLIAFMSSFCVMVIELIAGRIMAPYIGVSLYTWTSVIGVILAGIALGNYAGGKAADRFPSPAVLVLIFLVGSLATVAILPAAKSFGPGTWLPSWPVMWVFALKVTLIFFLPAFVLSMASPLVIKLALADIVRTGGVVGTIYAFSTAGAILGTFVTGFGLISWFGTRTTVWLVAGALVLIGVLVWFSWQVPGRWRLSRGNGAVLLTLVLALLLPGVLFRLPSLWQEKYARESNYYAIRVVDPVEPPDSEGERKLPPYRILVLDRLVHSYVVPESPSTLLYEYENMFREAFRYFSMGKPPPRTLHLGGGGYVFPRYLEAVYPGSVNEVVEIDTAVTQVAYDELGLRPDTNIKTFNQDARLFLVRRQAGNQYDFIIGDVFNDKSTPYHLTTLEFDRMVKANLQPDGVYLVNIIDDYQSGQYISAFLYTLRQVFKNVYVLTSGGNWGTSGVSTLVIAATDRDIDPDEYRRVVAAEGKTGPLTFPVDKSELDRYLAERQPILLTDDHAPTDILVAPLITHR